MAENITIARPYANAIFRLATEQKKFKEWSRQLQVAVAVTNHVKIKAVIDSPKLDKAQIATLVCELCGTELDQFGQNVIKLLAENRRLLLLPDIAALYEMQRAEAENTVEAEVTSAFAVSPEQEKKIIAALKKRLGRDVHLQCKVDPGIIGGVVIRAGDLVMDDSIISRLQKLESILAH